MAIPETPIDVRFGSVEQRKYSKYLIPGQLDLAQNVVQVKEGLYEKRDGYSPMDRFTSAEEVSESEGDGGGL